MANTFAVIRETLWRDADFRAIARTAQCAYVQLLSQRDLDCAGVLTLNIEMLVKSCVEMSAADLWHDLKMLERARFIIVDGDTDEVAIRSYLRLVAVRSPNLWKCAQRVMPRVESAKIRAALAVELRRLGRRDADALANDLGADSTTGQNPCGTVPELFPNPSGTHNPSGTLPEPPVIGNRALVLPLVDGWVGESAPPQKFCDQHPDGTDAPCRRCAAARQASETWTLARIQREAAQRAARRAAIDACTLCEETGLRPTPDGMTRCTHNPDPEMP